MLLAIILMQHDAEKLKYGSRQLGGKWQFTVARMMYQSNRFTSNFLFFECSEIGTSFVFIGESKLHAAIW